MKVINFLRGKENNSISGSLKNPLFVIFIEENKKIKEITIQMHGEFPIHIPLEMNFYDEEAYENYKILKEYLLSEEGQKFLENLGLEKDKLIMELYKALVTLHSCFGWFKKKLLIVLEYLKYYSGKLGVK